MIQDAFPAKEMQLSKGKTYWFPAAAPKIPDVLQIEIASIAHEVPLVVQHQPLLSASSPPPLHITPTSTSLVPLIVLKYFLALQKQCAPLNLWTGEQPELKALKNNRFVDDLYVACMAVDANWRR